jgi:tetratricopeptide (TPR) repeat protein
VNSSFGNIGDADTYLARAELMVELDRFDEAREELGGALSADPAHVPALTLLAIVELQVGNYDDALTAAEAALRAEPTHEPALLARGHALALMRRPNDALDVAEEIQRKYPESWWHNVHYALIVRESRNGQDALDAAWVAVRIAPEEARAHLTLALVAATLGLDDLADRALAAARRLDPGIIPLVEDDTQLGPKLLRDNPDAPSTARRRARRDEWEYGPARKARARIPAPVRRSLSIAAAIGVGVPIVAAGLSNGQPTAARVIAAIGAVLGLIGLYFVTRQIPVHIKDGLRISIDRDRVLALGVIAAGCAPLLSLVYAATGVVYLLAGAMAAGFVALGVAFMRGRFN